MKYRIRLIQSKEGWAVNCPTLPGCHAQGHTREEAIENMKRAIREWLDIVADDKVVTEESDVVRMEEEVVAL